MSDWEKNVKKLVPYVPGEQPREKNIIKLNTNENPYPPAPAVQEVLEDFYADELRRYPEPTLYELRGALAQFHGVEPEQVFVGVGSDDVLAMSFLTYFSDADMPVRFPDITYSFYDVWCQLFAIDYEQVPVADSFAIEFGGYEGRCGGIVIANPNAPTGLALDTASLGRLVESHPECVVIVDEAYVDFGGESMLPYIERFDNLLVVRTFSKSRALAGSRIGYAMGSQKLIGYLLAARDSFNSYTMDTITQRIGVASVRDVEYFERGVARIVETRRWCCKRMQKMGFDFPETSTNFIFARHRDVPAEEIFTKLRDRGIYVRYFKKPRIDNYLRITIGTDEQMEKLFEALDVILSEAKNL
ncbi:MAG: histidinol-phosphate transaminase [Lachnospiraceae bacterium]|nr:histidinol-phosphate transaminase [Lachnospiraceae bacterium]